MVVELLDEYAGGGLELHHNHFLFLKELFDLLDPYEPMINQRPEWALKKLYWLYDWKLNGEYCPESEYGL